MAITSAVARVKSEIVVRLGPALVSYGPALGEHRSIPGLRGLGCGEPEGRPYAAGPTRPMALRPATEAASDAPHAYPVESSFLQADRIALSLRGALERTTVPLARAATALVAAKAWCDFGFARLDDYARERLGRSGRWVRDLAALGERLDSLPTLASAITGQDSARPIGRVAALLIARIAMPESVDGWVARARASSIRALRDAVRAARTAPADASATPPDSRSAATAAPATAAPATAPTATSPTAASDDDDDAADLLLVRMTLPAPMLAAFDEAVDLFRAVEGGNGTIASFVEALIAEAAARGTAEPPTAGDAGDASTAGDTGVRDAGLPAAPPMSDADMRALRVGPAIAAIERALAASTGNWRHLPEHVESSWALSLAGVTLARFRALADEAGHGRAVDLDRQMRALVDLENEIEARLGGLLADLADRRAWPRLRFAGVGHYGEERLGLSRTTAEDRARLARDLRNHPRLRDAYAAGRLGRETAALVARLLRDAPADPASETAWVARATESTVKRMRDEARALGRYRVLGPRAAAAPAAPALGHALTPLEDAAWHASLRREPGLARRRIHLFGRLALTSPDVFHAPDVFQALPPESDTFLRLRLPLDLGHQFLATVDIERRRLAAASDAIPWDAEADIPDGEASPDDPAWPSGSHAVRASWQAARMFSIRCRRLPAWVGLLSLIEEFVDTWDDEAGMPRRPGDEIYIRDGWRCMAPGCTSRRNLESHHLRYRSRGGGDDSPNRICLCQFHHQRGEHGGLASCRGHAPIGVVWRLGRQDTSGCAPAGSAPAWYRNERRIAR
jgi:hypothetical protein